MGSRVPGRVRFFPALALSLGAVALSLGVLALPSVGATVALAAPAPSASPGSSMSPTALAKAINVTAAALPSKIKWTSSALTTDKADQAAGKVAAACLEHKAGAVTPDAFGALGLAGGVVLADVKSPQYSDAASSFTQLPAANSEIVIVKTSKEAIGDLAAMAKKAALACLTAQYLVESQQSGSGSTSVTPSFMSAPRYGEGNGGVHVRLSETGGLLPATLYDDEYFYAEGSAEVGLSFFNLSSPFERSWADQAIGSVMKRAEKLAG